MPLSPAPALPSPAQLYKPTGLLAVAFMYCKSMHSSVFRSCQPEASWSVQMVISKKSLTRTGRLECNSAVGHGDPLLPGFSSGAVFQVDAGHIFPVACTWLTRVTEDFYRPWQQCRGGDLLLAPASRHRVVFASWIVVLPLWIYHCCSGLLLSVCL
jgi:hypothetical protein